MLFSSTIFLFFFFPLVLIFYYMLWFSRPAQNVCLFVMSLLFYAWGEPINVLLLLGSILINWFAGLLIQSQKGILKKIIFFLVCLINIGMLGIFKYTGFIVDFINSLFENPVMEPVIIALPIGISFFTFQAMSYVIDVYKGSVSAEKNPVYIGLYISFFPQLIAGPIVRYNSIAEQIRARKENGSKIANGVSRFLMGLFKKVLIANNVAVLADTIFNWSELGNISVDIPVVMAWLGLLAYTLQIYYDFSGYSDMAIGLGLIFGFEFDENFNYPYAAISVSDFWKRWHISLTSWFREYVYFPLGGSRVDNKDRMVRNMFIVWLLTGIWHGAGWNFIFWGLWHFIFQLAERFFGYGKPTKRIGLMRIYTLLEVAMGWVLFRTKDLYQAYIYYKNLFGLNGNSLVNARTWFLFKEFWVYLLVGIVFSMPILKVLQNYINAHKKWGLEVLSAVLYPLVVMLLFGLCVSFIVSESYSPFIYFNF